MKSLVCDLEAIGQSDRPKYVDLTKKLQNSISRVAELADGYSFVIDTTKFPLNSLADWITMERQCCPFLSFTLEIRVNGHTSLLLRGPVGTKDILRDELLTS